MKTLIAAVIASAVSFGAFAQPSTGASAPMAAQSTGSDSMSKPAASDTTKKSSTHKTSKKHSTTTKKSTKKAASAPAA
ncbi:MAG: hypothetical protein ACXWKD_06455 [Caldimonas sp.]